MGVFLYTLHPAFIFVVATDYFIRAFINVKYSPIRYIAISIAQLFSFKKKPINLAQKTFASRLGFLCAFTALVLLLLGYTTAAIVVAGLLLVLSFSDSVLNFCVGCIIYNFIVYPFYKNEK